MVGGGYTTFSSFSLQTLSLLQEGEVLRAGANMFFSVLCCMLAVWAGYLLAASTSCRSRLFGKRDHGDHWTQDARRGRTPAPPNRNDWQGRQSNRQLRTESGKPSFDRVANTTDDLIEINSLMNQMALPRGLEPLFSP
jgi:CrcB-like protein, Camphor Resistance (CrcB)